MSEIKLSTCKNGCAKNELLRSSGNRKGGRSQCIIFNFVGMHRNRIIARMVVNTESNMLQNERISLGDSISFDWRVRLQSSDSPSGLRQASLKNLFHVVCFERS